ncbi:MAG: hypothetical protein KGM44_13665 [bacterium]|nr:hypothetical protein [bacterium]
MGLVTAVAKRGNNTLLSTHKSVYAPGASGPAQDSILSGGLAAGLDVHCTVRLPENGTLVDITFSAYANVAERAAALGFELPTALVILPSNFEHAASRSDLSHESSTSWLSSVFSEARVPHTVLLPDRATKRYAANRNELFRNRMDGTAELPLICASPRFVLQSFEMFSFVMEQLFAATQMAKGRRGEDRVRVSLVVGPSEGRYMNVSYVGPTAAAIPVALTIRKLLQQQHLHH